LFYYFRHTHTFSVAHITSTPELPKQEATNTQTQKKQKTGAIWRTFPPEKGIQLQDATVGGGT
jgi:hypothetical protein